MARSKVEVMTAVNPQISLTIGNSEIVNMLVQARVKELKKQLAAIDVELVGATKQYAEKQPLLRAQMEADFQTTFGKKIEGFIKAFSALSGQRISPTRPFGGTPEGWAYDGIFTSMTNRGLRDYYGNPRVGQKWQETDKIPTGWDLIVEFVKEPSAHEIKEIMKDEGCSKEEAIAIAIERADGITQVDLVLPISEEAQKIVQAARELDNVRLNLASRREEINALLANTPSVEKEILAKMTQNTLESNPELAAAFGVLCQGMIGLSADSIPALPAPETSDAEVVG
jgi:hypothetical protein